MSVIIIKLYYEKIQSCYIVDVTKFTVGVGKLTRLIVPIFADLCLAPIGMTANL
ncbi:MAG: hypothetical protein Ta2B_26860 [Termitinemataceae bacterium]|nr:MAG: hypothetical protein Ta2B_26860 [Termitinemataceae bacterium]